MPANTTHLNPYPLPTEPLTEGAQRIRELAEALDLVPKRLAEVVLAAPAATIDFSGISQLYSHLELVWSLRNDQAGAVASGTLRFNADSAALYDFETQDALAAAVSSGGSVGQGQAALGVIAATTESAGVFAAGRLLIPDYRAAGKARSYLFQSAKVGGGGQHTRQGGGTWRGASSPAITRVTLYPTAPGAGNFVAGSRATLYGLP